MAGFDDFLGSLQGAAGNFLVGVSRGLQAPEEYAMGAAMQGAMQPLEADIRRGIRAKDMEQARKEYDLNTKQEYRTAVDINQQQAEGFRKVPDDLEGIRTGLTPQAGGRDIFGFTTTMPALDPGTAAGRVANIGRTP